MLSNFMHHPNGIIRICRNGLDLSDMRITTVELTVDFHKPSMEQKLLRAIDNPERLETHYLLHPRFGAVRISELSPEAIALVAKSL